MPKEIYKKIPVIPVDQPLGVFYLCSINSHLLSELTYPDALTIEGIDKGKMGIYKLSGNQREEISEKRQQIGKYIDSVEASFPNTIILGANVDDNGFPIKDIELKWEVEKDATTGISYLLIPSTRKNARIIDGQHRLRGFDFSSSGRDFDMPCSIYLDLPLSIQASIFATININQKKVDRSLAFELFGYNLDDEPTQSWSPEKLAIFITRKLNIEDESPLKGNVKVVARFDKELFNQGAWLVSTSVFVDGIMNLISSNPMRDREALNSVKLEERDRAKILPHDKSPLRNFYLENNDVFIYKTVLNFFKAADEKLLKKDQSGYLTKTVGIQALFDILKMLCPKIIEFKDISVKFFEDYLSKSAHINFEDKFFQASGIGRSRIKNIIALSSGLINIEKIKEKDREAYQNVVGNHKSNEDEEKWVWEDEAEIEINRTLENATWDFGHKKISIISGVNEDTEVFTSFEDFRNRLIEIAETTASNYMPMDQDVAGQLQNNLDAENIVDSGLEDYKENLEKMNWLQTK